MNNEPTASQGYEIEGEVPSSWYLEMKVERDRYKLALDWIKNDSSEGFRLVGEALRNVE